MTFGLSSRSTLLAILVILAGLAWAVLLRQSLGMDPSMAASASMGLPLTLFLAVWVVMMVAMMFPAAAPMILTFQQVQAGKKHQGRPAVATWIFVAGYMVVWAAAGLVAFAAAAAGEWIGFRADMSPGAVSRFGGAAIVLAGLYQLTPLKAACLSKCRTPLGFIATSWRDGPSGALRMGFTHGLFCLGCCWLLFVILFPLGIMNVGAMALITALILAEKATPWGDRLARAAAVVLIVYGVAVVLHPALLPTFLESGPTGMKMDMD